MNHNASSAKIPTAPIARSDLGHTLAVVEALIGQIYLVTVVSLIVSNLGRPTRRDGASTER